MRIHLDALGCRLNEAELEQWADGFIARGHQLSVAGESADVIVLNTCAVTTDAVRKSRQRLRRLQREHPTALTVLSGCHATLADPAELAADGVDLVVDNRHKSEMVERVESAVDEALMPASATTPDGSALFRRQRQRAFIKIQDGCRHKCTFCIVTVARGEERSRTPEDIIEEVHRLQQAGVHEIVLTGVHVGGYGSDLGLSLSALVGRLLLETSIPRIRFASVEPWDLDESFFSLFREPRVMPHLHLPLQSGSDQILKRMARRCRVADFRATWAALLAVNPDINITTDIIVGFPGEDEAAWAETLATLETMPFGHMHIFAWSPRAGTAAANMAGRVDRATQRVRSRTLHELAARHRKTLMQSRIGRTVDVLWERSSPQPGGGFIQWGYTPDYLRVSAQSDAPLENRLLRAELKGVQGDHLLAHVVD